MRGRSLFVTIALATAGSTLLLAPAAGAQEFRGDVRTDSALLEDCREGWSSRNEKIHCEVRQGGSKATGATIQVDGRRNGGATITGWDRDSIHIRAIIKSRAGTVEEARELASAVKLDLGGAAPSADGPAASGRDSWWVSYDIMVPRRSNLSVRTVNGPIYVADVNGKMELEATNGPVHMTGLAGDVSGRTQNGPVIVELTGARWDGAGLNASTQNGPVQLSIPKNYSAELHTGTQNGPMSFGIPITIQGRINPRQITTTLGSGGPRVRVVTQNGPVAVDQN